MKKHVCGVRDIVLIDSWGNSDRVDEFIDFYDDMLWKAHYAATLTPSYLNRQPYGFVIHDGRITLVQKTDSCTQETDGKLDFGVVLLHFTGVAAQWAGKVTWRFEEKSELQLPEGYVAVASCTL